MSDYKVGQDSCNFRGRSKTWCIKDSVNQSNSEITRTFLNQDPNLQIRGRRNNIWAGRTYADLITQAIQSSPDKRLTLTDIYKWMVEHVPVFTEANSATWKNSIRHNLSFRNQFVKVENKGSKCCFWEVHLCSKIKKTPRIRRSTVNNKRNPKICEAVPQFQPSSSHNYIFAPEPHTNMYLNSNYQEQFTNQLPLSHVQYNDSLSDFESPVLQFTPHVQYNVGLPNFKSSFCPPNGLGNKLALPQCSQPVPCNETLTNFDLLSTSSYGTEDNPQTFERYHSMETYRSRTYSNSSYCSNSSSPDVSSLNKNTAHFPEHCEQFSFNETAWNSCTTDPTHFKNSNHTIRPHYRPRAFSSCSTMIRRIPMILEENICRAISTEGDDQSNLLNGLANNFKQEINIYRQPEVNYCSNEQHYVDGTNTAQDSLSDPLRCDIDALIDLEFKVDIPQDFNLVSYK